MSLLIFNFIFTLDIDGGEQLKPLSSGCFIKWLLIMHNFIYHSSEGENQGRSVIAISFPKSKLFGSRSLQKIPNV